MTRFYEDLSVGEAFFFTEYTITAEEIRKFARQFDPQPFHLDSESGSDSVFDNLVASGWHTASLPMRFLVKTAFADIAIQGGHGVDELRWYEPVYAGDTLTRRPKLPTFHATAEVADMSISQSRSETSRERCRDE